MTTPRLHRMRRVSTAGRLLAVGGLLIALAIMLRVGRDPSVLSTAVATSLLVTIFVAFLADRFLASVLDHIDRYDAGTVSSVPSQTQPSSLRDAA